MIVKIKPATVRFSKERCKPEPNRRLLTVFQRPADQFQPSSITKVSGRADMQIADFDVQVAIVLREELLIISAIGSFAYILQRRHEIVRNYVVCIERHNRIGVL